MRSPTVAPALQVSWKRAPSTIDGTEALPSSATERGPSWKKKVPAPEGEISTCSRAWAAASRGAPSIKAASATAMLVFMRIPATTGKCAAAADERGGEAEAGELQEQSEETGARRATVGRAD